MSDSNHKENIHSDLELKIYQKLADARINMQLSFEKPNAFSEIIDINLELMAMLDFVSIDKPHAEKMLNSLHSSSSKLNFLCKNKKNPSKQCHDFKLNRSTTLDSANLMNLNDDLINNLTDILNLNQDNNKPRLVRNRDNIEDLENKLNPIDRISQVNGSKYQNFGQKTTNNFNNNAMMNFNEKKPPQKYNFEPEEMEGPPFKKPKLNESIGNEYCANQKNIKINNMNTIHSYFKSNETNKNSNQNSDPEKLKYPINKGISNTKASSFEIEKNPNEEDYNNKQEFSGFVSAREQFKINEKKNPNNNNNYYYSRMDDQYENHYNSSKYSKANGGYLTKNNFNDYYGNNSIMNNNKEYDNHELISKVHMSVFGKQPTLSTNTNTNINNQKGAGLRKKFVPPFKDNNQGNNKNISTQKNNLTAGKNDIPADLAEKYQDERYKLLDPKMVEMIESEIVDRSPKITWGDIAGLEFAKKTIYEMIVWPMLRPDIFNGIRAPPRGLLLFGPPGTGKTMIGRAIASESNSTFFAISASSLTSKWVGEGEKMVKTLFAIAQIYQPSVIFIDEIDSLLCARTENDIESSRRIKTEFLVQLEGTKTSSDDRILIIGATNRPQELDEAVRRRFTKRLYIPLPNINARRELINTVISQETANGNKYSLSLEEIEKIATCTKGYSGADMRNLCAEASMIPIRTIVDITTVTPDTLRPTNINDFMDALKLVKATVSNKDLNGYLEWNKNFGSWEFKNEELEN